MVAVEQTLQLDVMPLSHLSSLEFIGTTTARQKQLYALEITNPAELDLPV